MRPPSETVLGKTDMQSYRHEKCMDIQCIHNTLEFKRQFVKNPPFWCLVLENYGVKLTHFFQ